MLKIGDIIKQRRVELGFTQEELAEGICSAVTISRIESSCREPSRSVFEAIMQRLGLSRSRYNVFATERDLEIYNLKYDIDSHFAEHDREGAKGLLQQLDALVAKDDRINQQYIRYAFTLVDHKRIDPKVALARFEDILAMTGPRFFDRAVEKLLLTNTEVNILRNIAGCHQRIGDLATAIKILAKLVAYRELRFVDPFEMAANLTLLYVRLSKYIGLTGDNANAVAVAEKGLQICRKYGRLHSYPHLLFNAGYGRYFMDPTRQDGVAEMIQAYAIFLSMGDTENVRTLRTFFEDERIELRLQ